MGDPGGAGDLPPGLAALLDAAVLPLGSTLRSVVLFGSAAEGRLRATSDVNLLFVLRSFDLDRIEKLREPLRLAEVAARVAPGCERPILLHGVGLGAASTAAIDPRRAEALAKVLDELAPEAWSEHLAFVRAGGIEIGHLAAPPRTLATAEGSAQLRHGGAHHRRRPAGRERRHPHRSAGQRAGRGRLADRGP